MSLRRSARAGWLALACVWVWGCGGGKPAEATPGAVDPNKWPADDKSLCRSASPAETGGVKMSEMSLDTDEIAGVGSLRPNIRRVYRTIGEGEAKRRVVMCREVDTNLDGIKDVVRTFNAKGEALHEEADTDYDGKSDVWLDFVDGRLAQAQVDTNKDGKADVWKFYVNGQLQRIRRDRNGDGKPDVWEIYSKGRLERVGVDETYDGHVDRWDRDEQLKYEADSAERKAREELAEGADAGAPSNDAPAAKASEPAAAPKN